MARLDAAASVTPHFSSAAMSEQEQVTVQFEHLDVEDMVQEEKITNAEQVVEEMTYAKQISQDLNENVHKQQNDLDKVSSAIEQSDVEIHHGVQDLKLAVDAKKANDAWWCRMYTFGFCAVGILILVLYLMLQ